MRFSKLSMWMLAACVCHSTARPENWGLQLRQEGSSTSDTSVTATSNGGRPTAGPTLGQEDEADSTTTNTNNSRSSSRSATDNDARTTESASSSSERPASSTVPPSPTSAEPSSTQEQPVAATSSSASEPEHLPIQPRITPAFGFAGVVLILTGVAYALIGIKHKLMQVFLSNGYLAALAVTVLIDYVMKPPISDAIQGAFFVAIFMTGCLYGGGSLIFKEVTEGFGCLLGGFCLSMWFLCLKPGGLVADQTGKGIMIGAFCVTVWSLSFSHHTREYGLIGSTSFAGSTAFVLGVDCFSQAGLKEFWFYIWELNDHLFPLNTDSYPMTRGMIVELIVIILVTIIGVLSQIKLWRIVRARRDRRNAVKLEDERRRDVVEEAIGRHLERQNDKDRTNWEKQYGNSLNAKRSTVLWTAANPDKAITHIMPVEDKRMSSSVESLEMSHVAANKPRSKYSNRNLRQSTVTVDAIQEELEDVVTEKRTSSERLKALTALDPDAPPDPPAKNEPATVATVEKGLETAATASTEPVQAKPKGPEITPLPFTVPTSNKSQESMTRSSPSEKSQDSKFLRRPKRLSIPGSKRSSLASMLSMSPRLSTASDQPLPSESVEKLVITPRSSRASSLAATLDEEDRLSIAEMQSEADVSAPQTPTVVISTYDIETKINPGEAPTGVGPASRPRSPSVASFDFDEDPEALARPATRAEDHAKPTAESTISGESRPRGSESSDARNTTEQSSLSEGLTPSALEHIPKQTSHVVLSYRTNEWAKHIADAEAPVFAEPEQISEDDSEAPVQLAPLVAPAVEQRTLTPSTTPLPPHVASANTTGITAVVAEPAKVPTQMPTAPIAPAVRPLLRGKRSSTLNHKNSFIAEPIHEDSVSHFPASGRQTPIDDFQRPKSPPAGPYRVSSSTNMSSIPAALQGAPTSFGQSHPYLVNRSSSFTSLPSQTNPQLRSQSSLSHTSDGRRISRSSSMMSGVVLPMRSETRLDSYDSRQPSTRNQPQEQQRREALLTDWRLSQQQGGLINQIPKESVEHRRALMLMEREHKKLLEDQQKANRQQQQMAMDQVMRRPEMQDAHREAMRRMQAGANKKLTL